MGNRRCRGGDRDEAPTLEASWWRIAFSWAVALVWVVAPVGGDGQCAGAFVVPVLLFPVRGLLMLGVVGMGLLARSMPCAAADPGRAT